MCRNGAPVGHNPGIGLAGVIRGGLPRPGDGHLARLWKGPLAGDGTTAIGLYRAGSEAALDGLLAALPLAGWLRVTVTPLEAHPNDPATASR